MRRAALLCGLAGCFGQQDTLGLPCDFTSQCGAGEVCVAGTCEEVAASATGSETSASATTDSTATTTPGDLPPCEPFSQEVAPLASRIALVVDASAAAAVPWDDDNNGGTPEVQRKASLVAALGMVLPPLDAAVELGLVLSPSPDATAVPDPGACLVDAAPAVPVAPGSSGTVATAVSAIDPVGGAPLSFAMGSAVAALAGLDGAAPRAIVLVLAGAANCSADAPRGATFDTYAPELETTIESALLEQGIPTAVVGIGLPDAPYPAAMDAFPDGVNPHDKAQLLAQLGGLPRPGEDQYYRAQDGINLGNFIRDAFFAARRCVVPLPDPLAGAASFDVLVDDATLAALGDCGEGDGWVLDDGTIEICGSPCAALKTTEGSTALLRVECD